jgi:hypothetical protein
MAEQQLPPTGPSGSEPRSGLRHEKAPVAKPASSLEGSIVAEAKEHEVDLDMSKPQERTATAPTPPSADIRNMRPVDDPDSLGGNQNNPDGGTSESSTP